MKNTQRVTNKPIINNLTRNGSNIYLEDQLNFRIEDEMAYCEHHNCEYKTEDFFEAEDHWYKTHQTW